MLSCLVVGAGIGGRVALDSKTADSGGYKTSSLAEG